MPRAVVTGGAGFLGSHLCDRLIADGWDVVCVDNFLTGRRENIQHLLDSPHFELVTGDVSESLEVEGPIAAVLHLASVASPIEYLKFPLETLNSGSAGTMHALDLARRRKSRFLLTSTSEVYGDPEVHPQHESYWGNVNPVGPRSVYDESKRFAEAATTAFRTHHGVDTAIVRIFNTYGPRMRPGDGRAVPNFISQALRGDPITVAGDGTQTRSLCYVDDLIEGLVRLMASGHAGPINVGNPHELTMLQLANTVRQLTGSDAALTFIPRPVDDPMVRQPDISLARSTLGWAPRVALDEGLRRTIDWFREHVELSSE